MGVRREELQANEEGKEALQEVDNEAAAKILIDHSLRDVILFLVNSHVPQERD